MLSFCSTSSLPSDVWKTAKVSVYLNFSGVTVPAATETASKMQAVWERVRQYLTKCQAKDKATVDQHKKAVKVEAGGRVLLSTRKLKLKGEDRHR